VKRSNKVYIFAGIVTRAESEAKCYTAKKQSGVGPPVTGVAPDNRE